MGLGESKVGHEPRADSDEAAGNLEAAPAFACPLPVLDYKEIVLGHGSGGRLTAELIEKLFLPAFRNEYLARLDDQAVLEVNGARLAFTTDSFVVTPIFFPGGERFLSTVTWSLLLFFTSVLSTTRISSPSKIRE